MNSASILFAVWAFSIAANIWAAFRLYHLSLRKRYRFFWGYLLVQAIQNLLLLALPIRSSAYFWVYVLTEPLLWLFYVLVVRELYSVVFEQYQGIYTVARWSMFAAWTIAIMTAVLSLIPTWRSSPGISVHLYYFQIVERGVVFSLAIYLPLVLYFLSHYPIRLHPNAVVHCIVYSAFFLTDAAVLLSATLAPSGYNRAADIALVAVSGCCYCAWSLLLTREGAVRTVTVHPRDPVEEMRLLDQLDAMNRTLLGLIRR